MVADRFLSKRCTGKGTMNFLRFGFFSYQDKVRCGFCEDALRCFSTKFDSDVRAFHDLLTHLNCTMVFTLSRDRISAMRLMGRRITFDDEFELFGALVRLD
ncbi:hypothetical protein L195_g023953 [Trifolium pratense]|uniref:Uncharacterized protein n=1 Tax=Trifolium pratense TaxID=57577 RepID=A0A2K3NC92_TRIPR|nr:hypothetical protein L195_g023953 [Trifolium pratense]